MNQEIPAANREDLSKEISACKYLYVRDIREPHDNTLRLLVEEAKALEHSTPQAPPDVMPEVARLWTNSAPIESDSSCKLFQIIWSSYLSYVVSNETYCLPSAAPEIWTGYLFREYRWSYLLEWTKKTTYASDDHPGPGPIRHFEIVCLNHVISVITAQPPEISLLR